MWHLQTFVCYWKTERVSVKGRKRFTRASGNRRFKRLWKGHTRKNVWLCTMRNGSRKFDVVSKNKFHRIYLHFVIPQKFSYLSFQRRLEKLNCTKTLINWVLEKWENVIYSAENKIFDFCSNDIKFGKLDHEKKMQNFRSQRIQVKKFWFEIEFNDEHQ